jgi:penicillin-binding protein 1C
VLAALTAASASAAEAALLVALPQAPETRRLDRYPVTARAARDAVLDWVFARGIINKAERDAAKREAVPQQGRAFPMLAAHASEAALRRAPQQRIHRLTLDAKLQASLEGLVREAAAGLGPKLSCAILVVDNASGEILAHVGAADYFSQERAGSIDMTGAIRSPGSALKPFIYALAFENGIAHPETLLDDRPRHYGTYAPENFDHSFQGTVTARRALQLSLNLPAVELLDEIGPLRRAPGELGDDTARPRSTRAPSGGKAIFNCAVATAARLLGTSLRKCRKGGGSEAVRLARIPAGGLRNSCPVPSLLRGATDSVLVRLE